jgi:hypothetical protein
MTWFDLLSSLIGVQTKPSRSKRRGFKNARKQRVNPCRFSNTSRKHVGKGKSIIAFHGTSPSAARDIVRRGWKVGPRGLHGTGVYFATDQSTAKSYSKGAVLKLRINVDKAVTKSGNIGVVRAKPQGNVKSSHFRTPRIKVIGVYDPKTNRRIHV